MNRGLLLALVLLVGAGVGLYAAGLGPFAKDGPADGPTDPSGRPDGGRPRPRLDTPTPGTGPAREVPAEEPPPQRLRLERTLRTLFVMERLGSWTAFIGGALRVDPLHTFTSFSADPVGPEAALVSAGQEPVLQPPSAAWFAAQDVDVLVIAGLDPRRLEDAFWQQVVERVRARSLGVLVLPGYPPADRAAPTVTPAVHPLLQHPLLSGLLPVLEPRPLEGSPVPGTFQSPAQAPFGVTDAGAEHPASRIVAFPEWSHRIWQLGASGPNPWGSKFVYPIAKLKPGAVTLVEARPEKGPPLPVYVLGPEAEGRVLWFGAFDFGELTYRDAASLTKWTALFHNALIFLAGRAP